jgi:hypothetical protein
MGSGASEMGQRGMGNREKGETQGQRAKEKYFIDSSYPPFIRFIRFQTCCLFSLCSLPPCLFPHSPVPTPLIPSPRE